MKLVTFISFLFAFACLGQKEDDSLVSQINDSIKDWGWRFEPDSFQLSIPEYKLVSRYNPQGAKSDIKDATMQILFPGGFSGIPSFDNEKDKTFQKKYKVIFHSQGCIRMGENEDEEGYNHVIFAYLDSVHGSGWRNELRADAIGFDAPEVDQNSEYKLDTPEVELNFEDIPQKDTESTMNEITDVNQSRFSLFWIILSFVTLSLILIFVRYRIKHKQ